MPENATALDRIKPAIRVFRPDYRGGMPVDVKLDHEVPLNPDLSFGAIAIKAEADRANADVIVVCSPNNPIGSILETDELESIVRGFGGLVVVDEAYHEFAGTSFVPLLERYTNLLLLRTFSKAMGLAGLRIGYLLAHRQVAEQIEKAKLPYSVNLFSCEAALVALKHFSLVQERIRLIVSERVRLMAGLATVQQVRSYPSAANFILFDVIGDRQQVLRGLLERGVLIRDVSSPGLLANAVRVSVGTPAENDRFLHALRDVVRVSGPGARTHVTQAQERSV